MRPGRALILVLAVFLSACSGAGAGATSAPTVPVTADLTIFGAASLANLLDRVKIAYEAAVPGTTLTISTDSSATLATQIIEGAPADLFLSADTTNPQKLVDAGLADGSPTTFATNELTIITPTDNPGGLAGPFDLGKAGIRLIAAGDAVPITRYATQLVDNLAREPGAPADFAAAVSANVASREDNVAAVRAKIELGEGDAAIVYVTDAAASDKVASIAVPASANVPARYDAVVLQASRDPAAAHGFLDWLVGPDGQAILTESGFLAPGP